MHKVEIYLACVDAMKKCTGQVWMWLWCDFFFLELFLLNLEKLEIVFIKNRCLPQLPKLMLLQQNPPIHIQA
jgi:hypothetical protein